jgi:catechol 2,3-dioxygenase-like lactoylglutathione lyase family enzyme
MQGVDQGLSTMVLRTSDLPATLGELARRGVSAVAQAVRNSDGEKLCDFALLPDLPDAATRLGVIHYARSQAERHARFLETGALAHDLPLKRLDHLAAVAPDLDRSTRFWTDVLGVPLAGEVTTPTTVIRQHRLGDAVFELLGPAGPDSPIRQRAPGLASMCSFEVDDLPAVVEQLRASGFTLPDAAPGSLPGTRTSTVPREQTGGLNLQLLQYV